MHTSPDNTCQPCALLHTSIHSTTFCSCKLFVSDLSSIFPGAHLSGVQCNIMDYSFVLLQNQSVSFTNTSATPLLLKNKTKTWTKPKLLVSKCCVSVQFNTSLVALVYFAPGFILFSVKEHCSCVSGNTMNKWPTVLAMSYSQSLSDPHTQFVLQMQTRTLLFPLLLVSRQWHMHAVIEHINSIKPLHFPLTLLLLLK